MRTLEEIDRDIRLTDYEIEQASKRRRELGEERKLRQAADCPLMGHKVSYIDPFRVAREPVHFLVERVGGTWSFEKDHAVGRIIKKNGRLGTKVLSRSPDSVTDHGVWTQEGPAS